MKSYLLNRFISSFIVLISVITISFFLTRVVPGDPISLWVGNHPSAKQIEIAKKELGLDKPLANQFFSYVKTTLEDLQKKYKQIDKNMPLK